MKKRDAMTAAGRLAFSGGKELYSKVKAAHKRRYYKELAESWDLWYGLPDGAPEDGPENAVAEAAERLARRLSPRARLLDLGCGDAALLKLLAPSCAEAHGADISRRALALARRNCRGLKNVRLHAIASDALPFEDSRFDLILCRRMLPQMDIEPAVAYLHEIRRVLIPGGRVLFDLPDLLHERYLAGVSTPGGTNWPALYRPRFWTVEMARAIVPRCGLRIESIAPGAWFEVDAVKA